MGVQQRAVVSNTLTALLMKMETDWRESCWLEDGNDCHLKLNILRKRRTNVSSYFQNIEYLKSEYQKFNFFVLTKFEKIKYTLLSQ